jgi:predicted secreted protein
MFRHIGWFTATVLYALIWWTVLFAVLPIGTQPRAEPDEKTGWRGAPDRPRMGRKVLLTTLVAALVWLVFILVIESDWFSFRTGWLALHD